MLHMSLRSAIFRRHFSFGVGMLPEYVESLRFLPRGAILMGAGSSPSRAAARLDALSGRLAGIAEALPPEARAPLVLPLRRRRAAMAEGCAQLSELARLLPMRDLPVQETLGASVTVPADEHLASLRAAALCTRTGSAGESHLSTLGRVALSTFLASRNTSSAKVGNEASPANAPAVVSALLSTRIQALACLFALEVAGSELPAAPSATTEKPAQQPGVATLAAAAASPPATSDYFGLACHVFDAGQSAVSKFSALPSSAAVDPRWFAALRGATAAAHASACRNLAASCLVAAAQSLLSGGVGAATEASTTVDAKVARLLSEAHELVERARATVADAVETAKPLLRSASTDGLAASSREAVAFLTAVDADLALHGAHSEAALAELVMLSALWAHMTAPATAGAQARSQAAAQLVLDDAAADDLARPLASAMALAEASLRRLDALLPSGLRDGSAATSSEPALLRTADYGVDTSGGASHPLRVLAALHLLARKPVMAEGLLRAALARLEADVQWRGAGGSAIGWPAARGLARYANIPILTGAAVGAALHTMSDLLLQWERREEEGSRAQAEATALLNAAAAHLRAGSSSGTLADAPHERARFMAKSLLGAASAVVHIGSAGFALDDACAEFLAAAEAAQAVAHVRDTDVNPQLPPLK